MRLGTLQDISLDVAGELKELYGQNSVAEFIARGKTKINGKAKFANMIGKTLNDLFFGTALGTGTILAAVAEQGTVPTTPFQVTVSHNTTFKADGGVRYQATGIPLTRVASAPAQGQYSVNAVTGVYTFAAADTNAIVLIDYTYTNVAAGAQINMTQQLMGFAPTFQILLTETLQQFGASQQLNVLLYMCVSSKLTLPTKTDDFVIPEFDFSAYANLSGQILDIYLGQ